MKAHLTRRYRFSASHRLHSSAMSEEENRRVYETPDLFVDYYGEP